MRECPEVRFGQQQMWTKKELTQSESLNESKNPSYTVRTE